MDEQAELAMTSLQWRTEWGSFGGATYLDTAAHSAFPLSTIKAVEAALAGKALPHTIDDGSYFDAPTRIRQALARLLTARPDDIALTTGASRGLEVLACSLKWQPGDEVITAAGEFPIQYSTWKPLETSKGIHLKIVAARDRFLSAKDLIDAITPRTRVISVSHVRFDDASLLDTAAVAEACRARGVLFALDVSQSCGAVPMSVDDLGADMVVSAGYKWLLGPSGAGFVWIRPGLLQSMPPAPFHWAAQVNTQFSNLDLVQPEPASGARRWDSAESATNFNLNLSAMAASVELVAKLGPKHVLEHGRALTDKLFELLPSGFHPASPVEGESRGAFGCFVADTADDTLRARQRLKNRRIIVSLRGGRIRVSPYLFNTHDDIEALIEALTGED
jgi:cysteine desulfurase/selenocysteine lyase